MELKRLFDLLLAFVGICLLSPFFLVIAAIIKFDSRGPVFFLQPRVGRHGRIFEIRKFRSMTNSTGSSGALVTAANDRRITKAGRILRRSKIDELPQLINVLKGEMSFVGPRPEVPKYVALYPPALREVILSVRPGITDPSSIWFSNEEQLLSESEAPERTYIEDILPRKIELAADYVRSRTLAGDLFLIVQTLTKLTRIRSH
jgi:lipopolysaccharide/colanic/teichoic acid biosynthesis glycosyltransferase